jgi:hypothetical protein
MTRGCFRGFQVLALAGFATAGAGCQEGVAQAENELNGGSCNFRRTEGIYGFTCSGSSNLGQGPVLITAVGVATGDAKGVFSVRATLNAPLGSVPWRLKGPATLDADCFGRVSYDVNEIETPPGSGTWIKLPPALFDFAVVGDGAEILGSAVAPGASGDDVPRLTCRLVRVNSRR